jgi:MFS family permease
MLCAGIIYGWASVAGTLLVAPFDEGGANLTMDETAAIFAVSASTSSFAALPLGYVLDTRGPRICSLVSHCFILVGCYTFASASEYHVFMIGANLMAFGGPGIQSAVIHLANLFTEDKFMAMSAMSGSVSVSFAILPLFDLLWERHGIGFRVMFRSYLIVVVLSALAAHVLWPNEPFVSDEDDVIEHDDTDDEDPRYSPTPESAFIVAASHTHLMEAPLGSYLRSNSRHQMSRHHSYRQSLLGMLSGNYSKMSLKDQPFLCQLFSGVFARILLVFCCTCFMANFYVASLPSELADLNNLSTDLQHHMARTFTLISSFGILAAFLIGWLMDRVGLVAITILTILMGQLHLIMITFLSNKRVPMILGFVFYTLFRQFLFPLYIASLSARLGFKYFGILNGLGFASSGFTQLFITSLVRAVNGTCHVQPVEGCSCGSWKELHMIQLFLLLVLMIVPLMDAYLTNREKLPISTGSIAKLLPKAQPDYGSTHRPCDENGEYDEGILI